MHLYRDLLKSHIDSNISVLFQSVDTKKLLFVAGFHKSYFFHEKLSRNQGMLENLKIFLMYLCSTPRERFRALHSSACTLVNGGPKRWEVVRLRYMYLPTQVILSPFTK